MNAQPHRWTIIAGNVVLFIIGFWIGTIVQPHWALGTLHEPYRIIAFFVCSFVVTVIVEQLYRVLNKGVPPRLFDSWTTAFIIGFFVGSVLLGAAR